jgi:hypothetical protein
MSTHFRASRLAVAAVALALFGSAPSMSAAGGTFSAASPSTTLPSRADVGQIRPLPGPGHFVRRVDNPRLPWIPGTRWYYRGSGSDAGHRVVVRALHTTKKIEGITATVVRDVERDRGRLIERTYDWYAQDRRGNVWYLGEATRAFEDGHVDTSGSWQAGVDGARAGIVMFAHPRVGVRYRQEFLAGQAEDRAKILDKGLQVAVPFGRFRRVLLTDETTRLEPRENEMKFYGPGVGDILDIGLSPEEARSVLVRMVRPPSH